MASKARSVERRPITSSIGVSSLAKQNMEMPRRDESFSLSTILTLTFARSTLVDEARAKRASHRTISFSVIIPVNFFSLTTGNWENPFSKASDEESCERVHGSDR